MTTVVLDTTVLSNFAHIQQARLLEAAFNQPVTVPSVMEEMQAGMQLECVPALV